MTEILILDSKGLREEDDNGRDYAAIIAQETPGCDIAGYVPRYVGNTPVLIVHDDEFRLRDTKPNITGVSTDAQEVLMGTLILISPEDRDFTAAEKKEIQSQVFNVQHANSPYIAPYVIKYKKRR